MVGDNSKINLSTFKIGGVCMKVTRRYLFVASWASLGTLLILSSFAPPNYISYVRLLCGLSFLASAYFTFMEIKSSNAKSPSVNSVLGKPADEVLLLARAGAMPQAIRMYRGDSTVSIAEARLAIENALGDDNISQQDK